MKSPGCLKYCSRGSEVLLLYGVIRNPRWLSHSLMIVHDFLYFFSRKKNAC